MSLFKKKEETPQNMSGENLSVKVLGGGCKSCHTLLENTEAAVKTLSLNATVEYITDMEKVMSYGAMSMPLLVINEKIEAMGKVLTQKEVEVILKNM